MENEPKKSSNIASVFWLIFFFPIGLYFMWTKTNWNTKIKWGITGFYGILLIFSLISGTSTTKNATTPDTKETAKEEVAKQDLSVTPQPTNTPTIIPSPVPKDINGFPMDAEQVTVANLDKAPSKYNGKKIVFTCTIVGFAKDSSGNAAAVNCSDPNDFSSIVQVSTDAFDNTKINKDDTVKFYGVGMGSSSGQNAFGGEVSETIVMGMYINDLTSGYKQ